MQIQDFDHFLFVSPHLDDTVLSCGLLLQQVVAARKKLTVATLFIQGDPRVNSPLTNSFLKQCGFAEVNGFFRERRQEDQAVIYVLKARWFHAGFTDAAWRINPTTSQLKLPRLYWEDFPYNTAPGNVKNFFRQNSRFSLVLTLDKEVQKKTPLINFYRS